MTALSRRAFLGEGLAAGAVVAAGVFAAPGSGLAAAAAPAATKDAGAKGKLMSIYLKNVCIGGQRGLNVLIENGAVAAIGPTIAAGSAEVVDCAGALLLPSFIDAHVHLDKTRIGAPRLHHPVTATVAERAANERLLRVKLHHDPFVYGSNLVHQFSVMGTTHIRSHIDVDSDVKLRHVEAILKVREKYRGLLDMELVAFPQSGIVKSPGVAELMGEAIRMGVDIVGGLDPEVFDNDRAGHLDRIFGLADKTGAPIDIHLHEPGEVGLATIKAIVERTKALGMRGRVTISHGFALGQISKDQLAAILPQLVEQQISVLTSAPGSVNFPPVDALLDAGVLYGGVSDNIQDMWSPWGNGDQLERAMQLAYRAGYRADPPLRRCFAMITENPAKLLKLNGHSLDAIKVGMPSNLTAVPAEDVETAILQRPARLFTIKAGRFIARNGVSLLPA
jgi:cytosine/adenosine deaminase-related metal-dependent hydrolase